jgi:hypothetical protein
MATHLIVIQQPRPGKFDVRWDDGGHLLVESTDQPFLEAATALLAGGFALPEDMLVMKFSGSVFEIRRGRIKHAVRNAAGRPPMRVIEGWRAG